MRLLGTIFACLFVATGCRPVGPSDARQVVPELTMDGVQFQVDHDGVTTSSGEAERLTYRRDTTDVAAVDLTMDLSTATGMVHLTAPSGAGHLRGRHFRVTGGIRATRGTDVATTPSATARPGPDGRVDLSGDERVEVTGVGYRLHGTGFDIASATGELTVRGQPHLITGLGRQP